eukprot:2385592-Rhodomonas_salina.1
MIKTRVVNKVNAWLLSQHRHEQLGQTLSLPFQMVPVGFWYWALGLRWLSKRGQQCTYNRH